MAAMHVGTAVPVSGMSANVELNFLGSTAK